ncbi:MAG: hypothetical protein GOVbin1782_19 [Prokaryotic dsDNA virus sp.]|nr:MAG: hypothetical protein GOVbin1782_19 [Prokaryotic dsDNA virus sp.]|tara:strand:+ start:15194 stop:15727 length:534 start_codon:yes stop_codon:yes gene_type:complete
MSEEEKKEEKKEEPKLEVNLVKGEEDVSKLKKCVELILSEKGKLALGQALTNTIQSMENREPEMWREYDKSLKDMKYLLRNLDIEKSFRVADSINKDTKYYVKKNGEVIAEYDDTIHNSIVAVEVAKNMHSVDSNNYYSASVEVTFSPVLIEGGSKEPQEIGIWSSDSVISEDEFNF